MNDSQSSDVFSDSGGFSCKSPRLTAMDTMSYETLLSNTKINLSKDIQKVVQKSSFSTNFTSVLEDCGTCIFQSLDLIIGILSATDVELWRLCEYMENAVWLLQRLSGYMKGVVESISLSCSSMKTFPTTTGHILRAVFTHCKDSESIYGVYLKTVEKQLKDLFRTCHELQVTYLMILDKQFIFDLNQEEELAILIDALDINLKIGEIVQTLDVKTMAEQWKAYTMICEKHADCLKDKHIYNDCTKILSSMIESNIKIAFEADQEEKIVLRSLKVASFTIKILLRVCTIFKHATKKNHEHVVDLLLNVYLNNSVSIEEMSEKSPQLVKLIATNVTNPTDAVLRELVLDDSFANYIVKIDMNILKKDEKLLGYIVLIVNIIKSVLEKNDEYNTTKRKLIECIFSFLPYGHIWFNMGLKFRITSHPDNDHTYGLYEYLLTHTLGLAATLIQDDISVLERRMCEALLGFDCSSAMFSSNLWTLLARMSPRQYSFSQLISLCKIYQTLENHKSFEKLPQKTHLSHTMSRILGVMHNEDKTKLYKQYNIHDEKNTSLWTALQVRHLPEDCQNDAEDLVMEKLKIGFHKHFTASVQSTKEVFELNKTMKLASTCSFIEGGEVLEEYVLKAWSKICPNSNQFPLSKGAVDRCTQWYLEYIQCLASLTESLKYIFHNSINLVKVLHVISNMIQKGNTELKLTLVNLVCKLSLCLIHDENKHKADTLLVGTFKSLLRDTDDAVKHKFYNTLRYKRPNKNLDNIIAKVNNEDNSLRDAWNYFIKHGRLINHSGEWKEHLIKTMDMKYSHKCLETADVVEPSDVAASLDNIERSNRHNFDFADIDMLFDAESEEPASKKVKPNTNEAEEMITRLENDTVFLCNVKENVFTSEHKHRIRTVYEKLKNIID